MRDMFGNQVVKRALPLSQAARDALGVDVFVVMNAQIKPEEVRGLLKSKAELEAALAKAKPPEPGEFGVNAGQLRSDIAQHNRALSDFFSMVWATEDGQPIPADTVEALGVIVGPGEAKNMQNATLKIMEDYQGAQARG